jgi:hypothetical protein
MSIAIIGSMNIKKAVVLSVASLMFICGCDNGSKDSSDVGGMPITGGEVTDVTFVAGGGMITVEKKQVEHSCVLKTGGEERTVIFSANIEYPMHFGIPKQEYQNLKSLVDEMFNNGTNFEISAENVFSNLVESVRHLSTNEASKANRNYSMRADGKIVFTDERYFSYKLEISGGEGDDLRTYDRKLGRTIILTELISTNDFGVVCKQIREYVNFALGSLFSVKDEKAFDQTIEKILHTKLSEFIIDQYGLIFYFKHNEWHLGLNMEVRVSWDSIKDVLIDKSVVPTGKFNENAVYIIDENDPEWWKFPIEKYEYGDGTPPEFLWKGTNYPYASIGHSLEIPSQGNIPKEKYDLFHSTLGAFITHGKKPYETIKKAVYRETVKFWFKHIEENKKNPKNAYGIYMLNAHIPYRGPEYVSYCLSEQDGPPSGTVYSNFVWNWRTMRQLKLEEIIDMNKRRQLWEMIRKDLSKDNADFVWPDWAKKWPTDMTNFWLDGKGVYWEYWAGEVFAGYNGQITIFLSWEELKPIIRMDFTVPTK